MGKSVKNVPLRKSKRNMEFTIVNSLNNSKEEKNINTIRSNLISTAKQIAAPFGSSSIKTTLKPSKISNAPGPGSYGQSPNHLNFNTIFNSNKFFITGDTRFKSSDNHIPGVGEYNINMYNIYNNKFSTPKKNSSYTYKRLNLHEFILNEKLQTLPNRDPLYNIIDPEDEELLNLFKPNNKDGKNEESNFNSNDNSFTSNNINFKHNNAIDWKKVSKKNLETENNSSLETKKIPNDFVMLTEFNVLNNNNKKDLKKIILKNNPEQKQVLYKNNILGFKDNFDLNNINLTSIPFKNKKNKKDLIEPGPGAYDPINNNFRFEPKKNRYQNFGTYESRNMRPIPMNKKSLRINTENNLHHLRVKKVLRDNMNKLNKYKRLLHNLRLNIIKEQAKQYKNNVENNLGPGSYSPESLFNMKKLKIKNLSKTININNDEERKPSYIEMNENPGVGEYDTTGEYKNYIEKNLDFQKSKRSKERNDLKIMMENYKKKMKKKERTIIRLDYRETEEYRLRKLFMNSNNVFKPPFNSAVPKFQPEKKIDADTPFIEDINYQKKEMNHKNVPFLSRAKRFNKEKNDVKSGPGSYEQRSFFDWNKKSFNVQYKLK